MGDRGRGLFRKFFVSRTDGSSGPGKKHDGCDYFVLDLTHDPFARPAIAAYADACRAEYPLLAADLDKKLYKQLRESTKGWFIFGYRVGHPELVDIADEDGDVYEGVPQAEAEKIIAAHNKLPTTYWP